MTLKDVADGLVEANKTGSVNAFLDAHYAPDAVSVEAFAMDPSKGREVVGLDAIRAKHAWWESAAEMHSASVQGPFLHGDDRFACIFEMDVTMKDSGERMAMREIAVYQVTDGKIVREEFYYTM